MHLAATPSRSSIRILSSAASLIQQYQPPLQYTNQQRRGLSIKSPGPDPLELLRKSSEKRQLCDDLGFRKPDVHWVFGIATSEGSNEVSDMGVGGAPTEITAELDV